MLKMNSDFRRHQPPAFNVPWIILTLVGVMLGIHAIRDFILSDQEDLWLLIHAAFIPARLTYVLHPATMMDMLASGVGVGGDGVDADMMRYFLGNGSWKPWTVLTYAFIHGDWMHVGVNSLWLVAFGSPVARRFGPLRFLIFFCLTAIAGVALHYIVHAYDVAPVIGASASVSGAMGAALRFVFQPALPDYVLPFESSTSSLVHRGKALGLKAVFTDRRTLTFMLLWFGINFIFGIAAAPLGITNASIAWEAHMGGFIAGLTLFSIFDPVRN